jgi:zinc transport system substrate-binding protein
MTHSRRSVLRRGAGLATAGAAASVAGCTGATDAGSEGFDSGYAAFFTLNDWANEVAGEHASFEDPVEVGQLGHGWEPDGTLATDVAAADAFVYLDTPEFSWAQDLAETLEADYDDVAVIDALDGVEDELLPWDYEGGHDHEGEGSHDHEGEGSHDHEGEESHDHDGEAGHDGEDGHDHGGNHDPHVWVDPVLAGDMVETIADGLSEIDPANAESYVDNATSYVEELDEIDAAFASIAETAERDVAVIAGHDSFQYLDARYGLHLHSPVGVSPQNEPSQSQIADTIELVDEVGIDVILYDRFASQTLADAIVENSDATETMPVTPAGGTTEEWNEAGYGYLEQMTEVNLPAFERAFGAE